MGIEKFDDGQLVSLFQEGKIAAFEAIYQRYWNKLYRIAFHNTGVQEDAEELVQEVFLSLWKRRSTVQIRHLDLYLTLAIKNQIYYFIRSQINGRKYQEYLILQEIALHHHTDELVNYSDLSEAVEKALSRLPEKSVQIFRRSRFENQSVKEIASAFQLSEKSVEYHLTRTLKFLRENLSRYQSDN
jgi:RNA polymerase sigma-70 factor (family 1)